MRRPRVLAGHTLRDERRVPKHINLHQDTRRISRASTTRIACLQPPIVKTIHRLVQKPYRIIRIDCPPYDGYNIAAYTNSLILNQKVFVPLFNIPGDAQALETFEAALPGYEVIGFPWGSWYYYDALHCRTRAIFDRADARMRVTVGRETPIRLPTVSWSRPSLSTRRIASNSSSVRLVHLSSPARTPAGL